MSDDKITMDELREMFGTELPMDAVHLLERNDLTTDQVRKRLRELSTKTKLPVQGELPAGQLSRSGDQGSPSGQYTNIFTIDGQPFDNTPMHPPVELGLAIQKLSLLNSNSQITAMWALAETTDENGNRHFAVIKYGRGADNQAFADRLVDLCHEYYDEGDQ